MPTIPRAFDAAKQLWYQDIPGRGRVYDSPAAYGQSLGEQGGGAFHKSAQWDQDSGTVDLGLDWGKIYAWAIGAGLGAQAALAIANAASASGAAAGGGVAGASGPVDLSLGYGPSALEGEAALEGGYVGSGAGGAIGSGAAGGGAIAAGSGAVGSGAAPAVGTAGAAAAKALTGGQKIESLLAGLGGLLGGKALGHYLTPEGGVSPELTQLLQLSLDRAKAQQPLFNQVNSGVSQMLPNFASKDGLGKLMGG